MLQRSCSSHYHVECVTCCHVKHQRNFTYQISYEVETQNGGLLRRNRRHIQHTADPTRRRISSQEMEPQWKPAETIGCQTDKQIEQTIRPSSNETPQITNQDEIYRTWSGRVIRTPDR